MFVRSWLRNTCVQCLEVSGLLSICELRNWLSVFQYVCLLPGKHEGRVIYALSAYCCIPYPQLLHAKILLIGFVHVFRVLSKGSAASSPQMIALLYLHSP